jgi:alpha-L-fucosidase
VELIGTDVKVNWRQSPDGLHVDLPSQYRPAVDYAAALKVILA